MAVAAGRGAAAAGAGVGAGAAGRGVGAGLAGVFFVTGLICVRGLVTTLCRRGAERAGAGVEAGLLPSSSSSGVEVAVGSAAAALLTGTLAVVRVGFLGGRALAFGRAVAVAVAVAVATAAWSLAIASAALVLRDGGGRRARVAERQRDEPADHEAGQQGGAREAEALLLVPGQHEDSE